MYNKVATITIIGEKQIIANNDNTKSRQRLIDKGLHNVKLRRKA